MRSPRRRASTWPRLRRRHPDAAPIDRSIPHSRDYTVTLLALACLLEALRGDASPSWTRSVGDREPCRALRAVASLVDDVRPDVVPRRRTRSSHRDVRRDEVLGGRGHRAWWDDLEEFGHGSQLMARPGDRAVMIAAAQANSARDRDGARPGAMGLDVVTVGGSACARIGSPHRSRRIRGPAMASVPRCIPLQALTYVEAAGRGLDVASRSMVSPMGRRTTRCMWSGPRGADVSTTILRDGRWRSIARGPDE